MLCNGDALWTLPDGHEVYVPNDGPWPDFSAEMPYVEEISEIAPAGAPMTIVDNRTLIADELAEYNCEFGWPTSEVCGAGTATESGGSEAGSEGESSSDTAGENQTERGCSCRSSREGGGALGLLAVFWARRRRRGSSSQ